MLKEGKKKTYLPAPALKQVLAFVAIAFLLNACIHRTFNKDAAARVGDQYLLTEEVQGIVPPGTNATDSLQITRSFINTWVRKQTVLQHAEKNLPEELPDFDKKLEDYRRSLLVYTYEQQLVKQLLDTIVTEQEIADYYNDHLNNFELKENILRADFVIIDRDTADKSSIKELLLSDSLSDHQILEEYCKAARADYFLDEDEWVFFNDLVKYIPLETYNQEQFLANNRYIEFSDSINYYFMRIKDFKIKESISPLDFEQENIRMIILNKRKTQLLDKMEKELFNQALKSNKIEIY